MPLPPSDNSLVAIAQRIRVVVEHQRGRTLDELAEALSLEPSSFRKLIDDPNEPLDAGFVLDVVTALAYCQGVDAQWLFTGRYDAMIHRHVLSLTRTIERTINQPKNKTNQLRCFVRAAVLPLAPSASKMMSSWRT